MAIDPGATLALWADAALSGPTVNDGLLHVVAGTTQLLGGMSGQGDVCIDEGADLAVHANASAGAVDVRGALGLAGPSVEMTVFEALTFHETAALDAPSGARVLMTGAALENLATVETVLADLAGVELVFTGGPAVVNPFEVASLAGGGLVDNFALGTLVLGEADAVRVLGDPGVEPTPVAGEVGRVQLVDFIDNGNRGPAGRECLFLSDLVIEPGSELDLNGLDLCIAGDATGLLSGWIAEGRLIDTTGRHLAAAYDDGSGWTAVPEPATVASLVAGGLGALLRRRNGRYARR